MYRPTLVLTCLMFCHSALPAEPPDSTVAANQSLLRNGDFEQGTEGWSPLWARDAGGAKAVLDTTERHGGAQALRIEHTGQRDWSLAHSLNLKVQPGEIYRAHRLGPRPGRRQRDA